MSQPEKRPEGASRNGKPRRGGRGDLLSRAFPLGDWGEPAERLEELYQWVEQGALDMVEWYLSDRRWKRRVARTLRAGTAAGVGAGAVLPLLQLTGAFDAPLTAWGFVALLGAAVCAGCDRWFGLTSGWMRDVATAQAVQRRLEALQYDWASESIREVLGPTEGTAAEAAERCLSVLRGFTEDVTELVRAETADWMVEFRATTTPLRVQTKGVAGVFGGAAAPRADGPAGPAGGRLPHPSLRPNMPRQRPPDR
ncbi:SLATT domain-containing protein [Streptomyces sp. RKND-216]|uniref:SLATT domain-containing protein n=1 Tax=Streptomyces sp. RKND-216 TaxID=2562581 RepID=UPI00109E242F|nr:SLATT domain-containing protein [Streptomyces sp. RKND-216]THA25610.1 SLATT domain-containing protein [Streptomyces sp. RKND-216]